MAGPPIVPSRRTFVRGAAWSVPVVAVAATAPAFAASSCNQRLDWDTFTTGAAAPLVNVVSGVSITRSYLPIAAGVADSNNGLVLAGPRGGIAEKALAFAVASPTTGRGLALTFTFVPAVYDLQFSIFDIDRVSPNGWQDRVTPTAGFTVVGAAGSNVTRTGDTFTATTNVNVPNDSGIGNVTLNYAGPTSSVTLSYVCGDVQGGTNMALFISDLTFCLNP